MVHYLSKNIIGRMSFFKKGERIDSLANRSVSLLRLFGLSLENRNDSNIIVREVIVRFSQSHENE